MSPDHNHDSHASRQLSLLVDMTSPFSVFEEVKIILLDMNNNGNFSSLRAVFQDTLSLFKGEFIGYEACDTPYHNLQHTTDVFLAMARLIHGAHIAGEAVSEAEIQVGLIAALMHDTGYIRKETDHQSCGAQLAPEHVLRSTEFMTRCLTTKDYSGDFIQKTENIILYTDHENASGNMPFISDNHQLLGTMLASADLLAQTADRTYLEKLPLLFREFKEVGTGNHGSELDLIKEAVLFNEQMHERLATQLNNVKRFLKTHFRVRWDGDTDLYQLAISRSMAYLESTLLPHSDAYRSHLRRALHPVR